MADETLSEISVLIPALKVLKRIYQLFEYAEQTHESLPADVRTMIDNKTEGSSVPEMAMTLAALKPAERMALQTEAKVAIRALGEFVQNRQRAAGMTIGDRELRILRSQYNSLDSVGSRSKRELERFYEAFESGDSGYVVAAIRKNGGKTKIEIRFASDLVCEHLAVLGL